MATKRIKISEEERITPENIERAIKLLEDGGTKKAACELLNIKYNTTRLGTIITQYQEERERVKAKKAEKRGKPATAMEVSYTISSYLEGNSIDNIASSLYRSSAFVRNILDANGVPKREVPHSYFKPGLVPEEAMRDKFLPGEKVYSMRYDSLAVIRSEFSPGVYLIFLLSQKEMQFAYQEAAELASLEHLKKLGVSL